FGGGVFFGWWVCFLLVGEGLVWVGGFVGGFFCGGFVGGVFVCFGCCGVFCVFVFFFLVFSALLAASLNQHPVLLSILLGLRRVPASVVVFFWCVFLFLACGCLLCVGLSSWVLC
ncbi:hypothetical protein RA276_28350, partial [Pseudomonas syringae pv. tagetis]|uniref:hypothetical protein n=1 Tax=Pseudomonas syringae group genomosp. 7 TaxID=251699 RepID=UPI0037703994